MTDRTLNHEVRVMFRLIPSTAAERAAAESRVMQKIEKSATWAVLAKMPNMLQYNATETIKDVQSKARKRLSDHIHKSGDAGIVHASGLISRICTNLAIDAARKLKGSERNDFVDIEDVEIADTLPNPERAAIQRLDGSPDADDERRLLVWKMIWRRLHISLKNKPPRSNMVLAFALLPEIAEAFLDRSRTPSDVWSQFYPEKQPDAARKKFWNDIERAVQRIEAVPLDAETDAHAARLAKYMKIALLRRHHSEERR